MHRTLPPHRHLRCWWDGSEVLQLETYTFPAAGYRRSAPRAKYLKETEKVHASYSEGIFECRLWTAWFHRVLGSARRAKEE